MIVGEVGGANFWAVYAFVLSVYATREFWLSARKLPKGRGDRLLYRAFSFFTKVLEELVVSSLRRLGVCVGKDHDQTCS